MFRLKDSGLNLNQQRFVEEYMKSGNATQSYKTAYNPTMTDDVAGVCSTKLLGITKVKEAIEALNREIQDDGILTVAECKRLLTEIANSPNERASDRSKAIELLLKTEGAFLDRAQVTTDGTVTLELTESIKGWAE